MPLVLVRKEKFCPEGTPDTLSFIDLDPGKLIFPAQRVSTVFRGRSVLHPRGRRPVVQPVAVAHRIEGADEIDRPTLVARLDHVTVIAARALTDNAARRLGSHERGIEPVERIALGHRIEELGIHQIRDLGHPHVECLPDMTHAVILQIGKVIHILIRHIVIWIAGVTDTDKERLVVGGQRVGAELLQFDVVGEAVAIGVELERIGAVSVHFIAVAQGIAVGIRVQRIGAARHLIAIQQAVIVRVVVLRIGLRLEFLQVAEPIAVEIPGRIARTLRVEAILHLPTVVHAVVVGVGIFRIGLRLEFLQIGQAVFVGILRGIVGARIEAILDFPTVIHTVAVGVGVPRIGLRQKFLQIGQAVLIRVLRRIIHPRVEIIEDFVGIRHAVAVFVAQRAQGLHSRGRGNAEGAGD